jgi:hypothetical protein
MIKELERLQYEKDCSGTSLPAWAVPKTKFSDKTANGLTKAVIAWINLNGGMAERIGSGGRYLPGKSISRGFYGNVNTKGKFIPSTTTNGTADISSIIKGVSWKIEIKIGADRQSPAQKEYQRLIESSGGKYSIVKNFNDFITQYNELISNL